MSRYDFPAPPSVRLLLPLRLPFMAKCNIFETHHIIGIIPNRDVHVSLYTIRKHRTSLLSTNKEMKIEAE